jgi:hypothetical protein
MNTLIGSVDPSRTFFDLSHLVVEDHALHLAVPGSDLDVLVLASACGRDGASALRTAAAVDGIRPALRERGPPMRAVNANVNRQQKG